ncbi:MAG: hypothetical protein KGY81_04575 [Phycisphaerae bacterium]|nr:hypothetical protein [Phycisphaerae bacterium]
MRSELKQPPKVGTNNIVDEAVTPAKLGYVHRGCVRLKPDGPGAYILDDVRDYRGCVVKAAFYHDDGTDTKTPADSVDGLWVDDEPHTNAVLLQSSFGPGFVLRLRVTVAGVLQVVSSQATSDETAAVIYWEATPASPKEFVL